MNFVDIFYTVADNIIYDLLHLLRIRNDNCVRFHQIGIVQLHIPLLQIQPYLLHTVSEIIRHVDAVEVIGNPIVVYAGIIGQLVDKPFHVVGLVVDGLDVFVHLLRRHCHPVHDALHIPLDGCDRCLQIMRDIAHQLPVLLLALLVLLSGLLQPQPHVLIVPIQIPDLSLSVGLQGVVQIPLLDLAHSHVQLVHGDEHAPADPPCKHQTGEYQNEKDRHKHIHQQMSGDQGIHLGHHKSASLTAVRKKEVQLLHELIQLVIVNSGPYGGRSLSEGRQPVEDGLRGLLIARIKKLLILPDNNIGSLADDLGIHHVQILLVGQPVRICLQLLLQTEVDPVGGADHLLHILRHGPIVKPVHGKALLHIHQIQPDSAECQRRQRQRQKYDCYEGYPQPCPKRHAYAPMK